LSDSLWLQSDISQTKMMNNSSFTHTYPTSESNYSSFNPSKKMNETSQNTFTNIWEGEGIELVTLARQINDLTVMPKGCRPTTYYTHVHCCWYVVGVLCCIGVVFVWGCAHSQRSSWKVTSVRQKTAIFACCLTP